MSIQRQFKLLRKNFFQYIFLLKFQNQSSFETTTVAHISRLTRIGLPPEDLVIFENSASLEKISFFNQFKSKTNRVNFWYNMKFCDMWFSITKLDSQTFAETTIAYATLAHTTTACNGDSQPYARGQICVRSWLDLCVLVVNGFLHPA